MNSQNIFQKLLENKESDPVEAQKKASKKLVEVVRQSKLRWWNDRISLGSPLPEQFSLLIIATYSNYDLWLLDSINQKLNMQKTLPIYVSNIDHYLTLEDLKKEIPIISELYQTPIFVKYNLGWLNIANGKDAREAVGEFVGMNPKEISQLFDKYYARRHKL